MEEPMEMELPSFIIQKKISKKIYRLICKL